MMAPGKWGGWVSGLGAALLLSLWLAGGAGASGSTPPHALVCPSGETVWLRGTAAPSIALLVRFGDEVVGGGSTGGDGSWAIPITVHERQGIYPVTVVGRQHGELLAMFTCYVDLPVGATATTMPITRATSAVVAIPNNTPTPPAWPLTPPSTAQEPLIPPPPSTAAPVAPAPDQPPLQTATAPVEPGATVAPEPPLEGSPISPGTLVVAAVQPDDPEEPGLFEYVIVESQMTAPQTLVGWQLINRETGEAFAIPTLTLPPGELLIVWSGDGQDEPDAGIFHWPGVSPHWSPGETVELHAPDGQIASTLVVPDPNNLER